MWGKPGRVRSRFAGRIFLGGVVIAGLFALPLVNLVAPVIATAFMLHIFEALPRPVGIPLAAPPDPVCGVAILSTMSIGCPIHV